ncbi:MAG: hypothetical protein IPP79_09510 [Chitinophagaceae bacterium]|nr:hypothetical protein [Chitinophagaceae bacterium]
MKKWGTGILVAIVAGWMVISGMLLLEKINAQVCATAVKKVLPSSDGKSELFLYPIEYFISQ